MVTFNFPDEPPRTPTKNKNSRGLDDQDLFRKSNVNENVNAREDESLPTISHNSELSHEAFVEHTHVIMNHFEEPSKVGA